MRYFISENSAMTCSNHTRPTSADYHEVTEQEYIDFLASLPVEEDIEKEERILTELAEKGYTIYK